MKKFNLKLLIVVSLMVALNVVLSRFLSISAWNIKIGFTFTTIFFVAYLYGIIPAMAVGALGDLIGALLFPIGAYFPGFTLTAALTGLVYGLFLKGNTKTINVAVAVAINELVLSLLLNTYWIHVLYDADFKAYFLSRIIQCIVMSATEIITMKLLGRSMPYFERRIKE